MFWFNVIQIVMVLSGFFFTYFIGRGVYLLSMKKGEFFALLLSILLAYPLCSAMHFFMAPLTFGLFNMSELFGTIVGISIPLVAILIGIGSSIIKKYDVT